MLSIEALPAKLVELDLPREAPPHGLEDVLGHGNLERVPVLLLSDLGMTVVKFERA